MALQSFYIDVTRLIDRCLQGRLPTGIDRVGLAYVEYFGPRSRAVLRWLGRSWVFPLRESQEIFSWLLHGRERSIGYRILIRALAKSLIEKSNGGALLLNIGHTGLERPTYARMLERMQVKPVFFIHDLIPLSHPEYCRSGEDAKHAARMRNALQHGQAIVCNSEWTLGKLKEYALANSLPMPPTVVAWLASDLQVQSRSLTRPITSPYFLIVGTIEGRKNHLMLLKIWRQLTEELGDRAPRLVVVGQRGWECEQVFDLLDRCETLRGVVIERSYCSDQELGSYLRHAQALLFPSFVEGFGIPLIEALAAGTPVVASDLPVFREVAGTIPDYLSPLDGEVWKEAVIDYSLPDGARRIAQLLRMEGFRAPTWGEHFARVDNFLEDLNVC